MAVAQRTQARQGRALRGLGAAAAVLRRGSLGLQVASLAGARLYMPSRSLGHHAKKDGRVLRKEILMSSSSTHLPIPEGPGSVSGAPNLPAGFTDTFTSRYIDTGELRLHAVIGGE